MSGELRVQNLGKSYRQWGSEWRRIASWFSPALKPRQENWVLKGINFTVGAGESVGIIGQNGAGKSTLLKLITGTTQATEGSVQLQGRVAAILELGMGFNPDMTGRQNAYHSAGLMGYRQADIAEAMAAIEAFAEIGEYFDQPMRTYSSGMQMRVAFSVATAFKPDLLIIDEALSVGDSYFQHKSFDRIRQFKEQGVSILFVTHGMSDIRTLCNRVILLDKGTLIKDGAPDEVVDYYNAMIAEKENAKMTIEQRRNKEGWLQTKSGTGEAQVKSIQLLDVASGESLAVAKVGQEVELRIEVVVNTDLPKLVLGYGIRDKQGNMVWGSNTWHTKQVQTDLCNGEALIFSFKFSCSLGPGSYAIVTALCDTYTHLTNNYEWSENIFVFDVVNTEKDFFIGVNWLGVKPKIARKNPNFV
jgi:lipopolysaccharide transport system ATP-binding protein